MNNIVKMLNQEKLLNELLNSTDCPDNIDEQFQALFNHSYYRETSHWFEKNKINTLHDGHIVGFSQKKALNDYNISFKIDSITMYDDKEEIGFITNSQFKINSSESLRCINNKWILNFLIDEQNKQIAFLYLDNNQKKVTSISYNHLDFVRGEEHLYEKTNKLKM